MNKVKVTALVVVVGLVLGSLGLLRYYHSVQRQGAAFEKKLNILYESNQIQLDSYLDTFYNIAGMASLKSDRMDEILTDACKGLYDGKTSAKPGPGQLFSAIAEVYPPLDQQLYEKIVESVSKGRWAYRHKQSKLAGLLYQYDEWCKSKDIPERWMVGGFPSQALETRVGAETIRGAEARIQMYLIVTTKPERDARKAGAANSHPVPGALDNGKK